MLCGGFKYTDQQNKQWTVYFPSPKAALPVLKKCGEVEWVKRGRRKEENVSFFPNGGWARLDSIKAGRVVGVADGDTITVLDSSNTQYKIRLSGIDAPEKRQAFGNVSKKSLSDLVFDKQVTVDWQKQDRYCRTVGKVLLNGQDVNLLQINRGMAWFYKKYQNELILDDRLAYLHAQDTAEQNKKDFG